MTDNQFYLKFIESINPWWKTGEMSKEIHSRPYYENSIIQNRNDRLIDILIGSRRVGKTSIMYSIIKKLLKKKIARKKVIFLTAEFQEIQKYGLSKTLELIQENNKIDIFNDKIHVFIDEVQEIPNWQKELKLLYDTTNIKFYTTGSSSLILSKNTSKLTGRYFLQKVLPLSFSEYLEFKKLDHFKSLKKKNKILDGYLESGGYPEYVQNNDKIKLKQAIDGTLYRDLLQHYGIRNPKVLEDLMYYLADKITNPVSTKTIAKDLKVNEKTAKFYLQYLADVYLIYPVYRKGASHKITKSSNPKYYFNDVGVLNLFGGRRNRGGLIENLVFLEFLRRQNKSERYDIYYSIHGKQEVDFSVKDKLYEVKSSKPDLKDLEKYTEIDDQIDLIYSSDKKIKREFYKNLDFVNLVGFVGM